MVPLLYIRSVLYIAYLSVGSVQMDEIYGNQDEIYGRIQAISALQLARDDSIYVLKAKGADSQFGCIGCKGSSITCNANPHFLPDELNGIVSFAEFSAMTRELNQVLGETHFPMLPLLLGHFCIPFSPICVAMYCAGQRVKRIDQVLQKHTTFIAPRGYYWEMATVNSIIPGIAFLKVNKTAAARYNQDHSSNIVPASAVFTTTDKPEYHLAQKAPATGFFFPSAQVVPMNREY